MTQYLEISRKLNILYSIIVYGVGYKICINNMSRVVTVVEIHLINLEDNLGSFLHRTSPRTEASI